METEKILVQESLQETLWRLEEVRQGLRNKSTVQVQEALEWVLSRQGLEGSYHNLFSPTSLDFTQGLQLPTGERYPARKALLRHILGEEALRTTIIWELGSSPAVKEAMKGFYQILERGGKNGFYCCHTCTIPFLRTLAVAKPDDWEKTFDKGLGTMRKSRTPNGRWHGFPFYYTLLMLSEIDTSSAQAELRHARRVAEKLLGRYRGNDRISHFRRLGLEATLSDTSYKNHTITT